MIYTLLLTLTAHADPLLPVFSPATVNAASDTCAAAEDDPAAAYLVTNDTTTLYSGDELEPMLTAASVQLLADADELVITANAAGKAAWLGHHQCLHAATHAPHLVTAWANTAGGMGFYEADLMREGDAYDFAAVYYTEGKLVAQFELQGATGCDDTVYVQGGATADGDMYMAHAKWFRPATPNDPGFALQTCDGGAQCSGKCELQYAPDGFGGLGGDPEFMCMCIYPDGSAGGMGCQGGTLPAGGGSGYYNEPSGWADAGGGVGVGGIWGGLIAF